MSLHRRAAKRDGNEKAIKAALEQIGVQCFKVSARGLPDLLTYRAGQWLPIEIKKPKGRLTSAQIGVRASAWYPVVSDTSEALALFGVKC